MKWDIKVFIVCIATILIYGGSYWISDGKFAFPLNYIDFLIAILSFVFVATTLLSEYTFTMVLYGASFTYLAFGYEGNADTIPFIFRQIRDIAILLFAIFLIVRVIRNKDLEFRGAFLFFGLMVLLQLVFNGLNFSEQSRDVADFVKLVIAFALCLVIFNGITKGKNIHLGIKRQFILLGIYFVRSMLFLLDKNDFI